jgi:integrase
VDLKTGVVSVQRTLEEIRGKLREKEPKSEKGRRRIDLPAFAVEAMVDHKAQMMAEGLLVATVFPDTKGGWLRKSNFTRKVYKPLVKNAGLPDMRFHDLRHGHATLMLALGEQPKVVQERLGHNQISMTIDIYSNVLPSVHQEAAKRLDERFRRLQG